MDSRLRGLRQKCAITPENRDAWWTRAVICAELHEMQTARESPSRYYAYAGSATHRQPIIAVVSNKLRARLLKALPQTILAKSLAELENTLRNDEHVIIVDPAACPDIATHARRLKQRFEFTPFIIYTELQPKQFRDIVELISNGITDVVLFGYDDDAGRLERLIEDLVAPTELRAFSAAIRARCKELSEPLRIAVDDMLRHPARYRSTQALARAAQMSSRAVFRHLNRAGFRSARKFVASARALRAYQLLAGGGRSGQYTAARLGYASVDQLSQHLTQLAGCTVSDVKRGYPPSQFVAALIASVGGTSTPLAISSQVAIVQ